MVKFYMFNFYTVNNFTVTFSTIKIYTVQHSYGSKSYSSNFILFKFYTVNFLMFKFYTVNKISCPGLLYIKFTLRKIFYLKVFHDFCVTYMDPNAGSGSNAQCLDQLKKNGSDPDPQLFFSPV
jgi:hypothetical protein